MIKHYWDAMMENTVPFLLAWEAYVFFMLIFFISIVYRLSRIERKITELGAFWLGEGDWDYDCKDKDEVDNR
ncbi:MAG: hypothetical protein CMM62_04110 [Rhodospirillaceae bacterium]|nr:hypothetical protein [Rhodospirillaceae bacterium]